MESGDDIVVREIDVYLTNELELYVLQFPLKPICAQPPLAQSARMRPIHRSLELFVPYDPSIINSENSKASKFLKYTSSRVLTQSIFAVGVIRDGAIHITPVTEVLQLRPSFKDMETKGELIEVMEDSADENEDIKDKDEQPMLQVQMKRKENDKASNNRNQSYTQMKLEEETELWQRLDVFLPESDVTLNLFEGMYYHPPVAATSELMLDEDDDDNFENISSMEI